MAKSGRLLIAAVAAACLCRFWPASFVPAPARHGPAAIAATAGTLGAAPAAFADKIDDAAKVLSEASYPFLKEINWNNEYYASIPGVNPAAGAKAIAKTLEMGAAMDPRFLKKGVKAHSDAISAIGKEGVTSKAAYTKINAAIGHMVASAGEAKTMAVYNAWKEIVPAKAPAYLKSTVNGKDAEKAYNALMEFSRVVKSEASLSGAAPPDVRTPDAIDEAAKALSKAAYPFMKEVNWNADFYRLVPGAKPQPVLKAIKAALDQGAKMDSVYLQQGALAHAKAIGKVDAKGVLTVDDFAAINSAIGHMIKSSGEGATMNTFNAFKGLVSPEIPKYLMSTVKEADAKAAYAALLEFKNVVRAGIQL